MNFTTTKQKNSKTMPSAMVESNDIFPDADYRLDYIATAAYYKAEARGFVSGWELDDWLNAESEFDEGV